MIALHGSYFKEKFGDLLLLSIYKKWIGSETKEPVFFPTAPRLMSDKLKKHIPGASTGWDKFTHWWDFVQAVSNVRMVLSAGPGYYSEPAYGTESWTKEYFSKYDLPIKLAALRRIPYAMLGIEAGPLSDPKARARAAEVFSGASLLSARNKESRYFMIHDLGVKNEIEIIPDAVMTIDHYDIPFAAKEAVGYILGPYGKLNLVGICHAADFLQDTPGAACAREALCAAITSEEDVVPVIFSDNGGESSRRDSMALKELIQRNTGRECLAMQFLGVWETVALISIFKAVVSTRLYVSMVAYALGVYVEAFSTSARVERFFNQISRPELCAALSRTNDNIAREKADRIFSMVRKGEQMTDPGLATLKDQAFRTRNILFHLLRSAV